MLRLENISVSYGGLRALDGVNLTVGQGEFVAIVGPNGAGKTTLFRAISGIVPLVSGSMHYADRDLGATAPHLRAGLGIAHVPEGRQVFPSLSVLENLEMGAQTREARDEWPRSLDFIHALFPRLAERAKQAAGTLSGGEQQMLAIGRGVMAEPRLLILDEPSLGLSPLLVEELFTLIKTINAEGIALLLVEQNVVQSLEVAQRAYILDNGRFVLQGRAADIRNDLNLKRTYLGM